MHENQPFVLEYMKYRCEISNGPISFHFIAPNFFLISINDCSKNNYWHNYFFTFLILVKLVVHTTNLTTFVLLFYAKY